MDRDPGDFAPDASNGRMSDGRFDAWLSTLPPAPGIRHIDDEGPGEDAEIEADVRAGLVYPHAIVGEWLKTAGTPEWKPIDEWLADRDG